jgi:cob(I)alamin adenosyltransferase
MSDSYVHIYTGDGKGKTTAAIGLAIRAAGAGRRVLIAQFVKGMHYSELDVLAGIDNIELRQLGRGCFIIERPQQEDIDLARAGLTQAARAMASGEYGLVILDEATIALHYQLFTLDDLWAAVVGRAPGVEVVITGRRAPSTLITLADLVTDMREVKHYYTRGIEARTGIEK